MLQKKVKNLRTQSPLLSREAERVRDSGRSLIVYRERERDRERPVYYYGGSIRINEPASEYYGTAFIDQGERLPFAQLKVFDESAFDNVPAGWRTGEAGVGVETDGGLSASTIAIIVGGAVCAIALCASAACIALVVARRASTSQSRRLAAANIAQTPGVGRSRSHSRTRSRRVSEKRLARF